MEKYSYKFKKKVVLEYLNDRGGYGFLAKKHNVVYFTSIHCWGKAYKKLGYDGLKRSRKNKEYWSVNRKMDKKMKRILCPPQTD